MIFAAQHRVSFYTLSPRNRAMCRFADVVWYGLNSAPQEEAAMGLRSLSSLKRFVTIPRHV